MLGGKSAVLLDPGTNLHQHRVSAPVTVEDLFSCETDLDWSTEGQRHLCRTDLVIEGIALATEPTTVGASDDPYSCGGQSQHLGQRAVQVVRCLGRGVDGDPIGFLGQSYGCVLLHRQVSIALEVHDVLEDLIRFFEASIDIAELHRQLLVQVALIAVLMDAGLRSGNRLLDRRNRLQRLVLDLHCQCRLVRLVLGESGHRHHRISDKSNLVDAECMLILADRQDTERVGHRIPGQEAHHPWHRTRLGGVDGDDLCVRHRRADQFHVNHAREGQVVGKTGLASYLGATIDPSKGRSDQS